MMGAHVIKSGLSLILIDLLERGVLTHVATNGAGSIHDLELGPWLESLPEGLDTELASGGSGLSAGEAGALTTVEFQVSPKISNPRLRHLPPNLPFSTTATFAPRWAAWIAAT